MSDSAFYVHPTAEVEPDVQIGAGTRIWRQAHVRAHASIGEQCTLGQGVYVDAHVRIGSRVKIQNYASLFDGVIVEDGVFIGPHVCFTNDLFPRAITLSGELKTASEWEGSSTRIEYGASIGAHCIIICGVKIGSFSLIGAGSVVTKDVAPYTLVFGNPASPHGYVCECAHRLSDIKEQDGKILGWCEYCRKLCLVGTASDNASLVLSHNEGGMISSY
ncbi:N-acetyltransferase [Dictyobacter vulcani]|uniref:N-acetyltransferase n=1 Tax=Dictyobacter vulcani TaxID=2607529 RepID=A0A5J4KG23_9CHLR|nr:acyltransferase [Dictyobacter vulcani]GER86365.1 N-acetyltransferase [Dictyobacter vulcani]